MQTSVNYGNKAFCCFNYMQSFWFDPKEANLCFHFVITHMVPGKVWRNPHNLKFIWKLSLKNTSVLL